MMKYWYYKILYLENNAGNQLKTSKLFGKN